MAAPPGVAAGVGGVDTPPLPPPILGGVEGLRFVALAAAAAVKGMRFGGCGSGTLVMGLRPAGVMMLA